jgi:spore germination cell wall hydrolase CwlJ-like protein
MIDALKLMAFLIAVLGAEDALTECPPQAVCIALAVFSEARGEPIAGQIAVASVVLERGRDTCAVIAEPGQFEGVYNWPYPRQPERIDPHAWGVALGVAHSVLAGVESPCPGSYYFHKAGMQRSWAKGTACVVGNHAFYGRNGAEDWTLNAADTFAMTTAPLSSGAVTEP